MKKIPVVAAIMAAATAQAGAQGRAHSRSHDPAEPPGLISGQYPGGRVIYANAPGGAYIDCDPRNPSSPVRCKPDGW